MTYKNYSVEINGLLILVLLLSLGLRLYRIQAQSLWNDEGTSVALAARDLTAITKGAANDIHPPLYYYVLHFWMVLFGNSELAVRSLSALLGTLLVMFTYALGRFVVGRKVGLIASFFAALSPFQIYYSQETRMYILNALLGTLSMYTFLRLLFHWQNEDRGNDKDRLYMNPRTYSTRRYLPLVAYAIATTLLLYTHYLAATIIVVQNLSFIWWLRQKQLPVTKRRLPVALRWVVLQLSIAGSFLPWLLLTTRQLRVWPAISEPLPFTTMMLDLLRVFSLGLSVEPGLNPVLAGFAVLLLLGILISHSESRGRLKGIESQTPISIPHYVVSLLYLFVPICLIYMLSLQRPMYNPKFLLLCTTPFYLFLAEGTLSFTSRELLVRRYSLLVARCFLLAAIIFVVSSSLYSLRAYYFDPRYARDDYRGIAQYIEAIEREDDAVLINAPGQIETFTYYYRGNLPLYPLPRQRPLDEAQTEADLKQMIQGRKRIFAVLWATDESDPGRFVEGWLDQHAYKAMDSWYGNVRLVIYAVPVAAVGADIQHPLKVNLGDRVRLLGYNLLTTEVMPGDILQLTLFWQAIAPIQERYKVFTHVVDAYGHLVGQRDAEPGGGAKITTIWKEGEQVADNYGLPILPATPPGDYMIEIGMYRLDNGLRLPLIEDGQPVSDHILLQPVRVLPAIAPPPISTLGMQKQLNTQFGDVTLLGYDLSKLGYEHQPDVQFHPGDILHLTLFWQANRRPRADITLVLQLQDNKGTVCLERRDQPTEGQYPTRQWNAGEIVRDQHNLLLPADLPVGRYCLHLFVQHLLGGQQIGPSLVLTSLTVR